MKKSDWIGLTVSLLLHLLLFVGFAFMKVEAAEEMPPGFIEVDFGPFQEGRPVQRAPQPQPEATEQEPEPEPEPQQEAPKPPPPEEARPVDLPDQQQEIIDEEQIQAPESENVSPTTEANEQIQVEDPEPEPEQPAVRPLGGGDPEGTSGDEQGDEGAGQTERRTAPFDIEGLNRVPVSTRLPAYNAQVNAIIRVRITVDPQGRIVQRFPLVKGNPQLEQAVMTALRGWRFNALPPNAPQENQVGIVTFRFRLE